MKYDFGSAFSHNAFEALQIENISLHGFHSLTDIGQNIEARLSRWRQRVTDDMCSQTLEPQTEPTSFETSVAGDQDFFVVPELLVHLQTFQGALPEFHNASS